MTDEYFILMNDWHEKHQKKFYSGVLDTICGDSLPIHGSNFSFPYDVNVIKEDTIYWNFDKNLVLSFDYRCEKGHIISRKLMHILKDFAFSPNYKKKLSVWMKGAEAIYDYTYIAFKRGTWKKGIQLEPEFIFYDREKSSFELNNHGGIIPTGNISLTSNAKNYDVFELLDTSYLGNYLVINEKVKLKLESEIENIRGLKIIPLNLAFNTYCSDYNISIDSILPKVKKKIP